MSASANETYVAAPGNRDNTQKALLCERLLTKIRETKVASGEDQYTLLSACHWNDELINELFEILLGLEVPFDSILPEIKTDRRRALRPAAAKFGISA